MFLCLSFLLFYSTKNVVFAEILVDQILKFLVRPVSAKIKSFERFFKQCIFFWKTTSDKNFSIIEPYLGDKDPKIP